jgi:hypothetical protein
MNNIKEELKSEIQKIKLRIQNEICSEEEMELLLLWSLLEEGND